MLKAIRLFATILFSLLLLSWGTVGHRTIGVIAEKHLSQRAKDAIQSLLGDVSLSEVSTWADEVRRSSEFRSTAPWHYINLQPGLSRSEFEKEALSKKEDNVYSAVMKMQSELLDPNSSRDEKINALKFIIHFVGDLHQPMHVSRAEDEGGNKIQVNYDGKGTNLHALWDSKLLEHEGLNEQRLADKIDKATPSQIKAWQSDPIIQWMWESYQISSNLYREIDQMSKRVITDDYYKSHLPVLEQRLEQAGVRLAGLLNSVFDRVNIQNQPTKQKKEAIKEIRLQDVISHMNEEVKVCGKVYSQKGFSSMTLLDIGAAYPNQMLTVVLRGAARENWKAQNGLSICITGKIIDYKGKPEIIINDLAHISVAN